MDTDGGRDAAPPANDLIKNIVIKSSNAGHTTGAELYK